jgi:hypothetical protein
MFAYAKIWLNWFVVRENTVCLLKNSSSGPVRLTYKPYFFNQRTTFFYHSKLVNSTFSEQGDSSSIVGQCTSGACMGVWLFFHCWLLSQSSWRIHLGTEENMDFIMYTHRTIEVPFSPAQQSSAQTTQTEEWKFSLIPFLLLKQHSHSRVLHVTQTHSTWSYSLCPRKKRRYEIHAG